MNQKTRYELTITDKLQGLPLPDMEDAIWARVKTQLDLDLPTDDNDGDGPDAPSGGSGWSWGGSMFILVAALVAVFFLRKNNSQLQTTPINSVQSTTPVQTPAQQQTTGSPPALLQKDASLQPVTPTGLSPGDFLRSPTDSIAGVPTTALPLPDSQQAVVVLPPVQADTVNSAKPKPKTKGVKGLTDDDYRIVPAKRDSL